jgi:hypothetical protein
MFPPLDYQRLAHREMAQAEVVLPAFAGQVSYAVIRNDSVTP